MQKLLLCFACVIGSGVLGCAPDGRKTMTQLLRRASFDLRCPEIELQAQSLGPRTVGVRGCGAQASYILNCQKVNCPWTGCPCTWVLNGTSAHGTNNAPVADDAPPHATRHQAPPHNRPATPKSSPPTKKRR